jgi:hypothetical protein
MVLGRSNLNRFYPNIWRLTGKVKTLTYVKGVESSSPLVSWFWSVMEEFTTAERSLFLRWDTIYHNIFSAVPEFSLL